MSPDPGGAPLPSSCFNSAALIPPGARSRPGSAVGRRTPTDSRRSSSSSSAKAAAAAATANTHSWSSSHRAFLKAGWCSAASSFRSNCGRADMTSLGSVVFTAFVAKALPLPCVSTATVAKTVPMAQVDSTLSLLGHRPELRAQPPLPVRAAALQFAANATNTTHNSSTTPSKHTAACATLEPEPRACTHSCASSGCCFVLLHDTDADLFFSPPLLGLSTLPDRLCSTVHTAFPCPFTPFHCLSLTFQCLPLSLLDLSLNFRDLTLPFLDFPQYATRPRLHVPAGDNRLEHPVLRQGDVRQRVRPEQTQGAMPTSAANPTQNPCPWALLLLPCIRWCVGSWPVLMLNRSVAPHRAREADRASTVCFVLCSWRKLRRR